MANGFEKHAQTAIQIILVAITLWVGTAIITLRDSSIRMEEKQAYAQQAVSDLRADIALLRTTVTASNEQRADLVQRLSNLENRVESLEKRFNRKLPNE